MSTTPKKKKVSKNLTKKKKESCIYFRITVDLKRRGKIYAIKQGITFTELLTRSLEEKISQ